MTRYARITELIEADRCVVLDGGTATELAEVVGDRPDLQERLWGTGALVRSPDDVLRVHRRYVDTGCDVISTDTWGLPTALRDERPQLWDADRPVHWMDVARRGVQLARQAAAEGGRADECAVAFSMNGDVDTPEGAETIRLLARVFEEDPPDIVLLETLSLVRPQTYDTVERLLGTGIPVWLSFRRCRQGVCGVYGEHWGGPEGDSFGRAARRFEQMGVSALLINCIPPDHVAGMISWMRDFTDLPLGAYPNLGYLSTAGWRTEAAVDGARVRAHGAGAGGMRAPRSSAAAAALARSTSPPRARRSPAPPPGTPARAASPPSDGGGDAPAGARPGPWTDTRGSSLYPLDFPDILCEPGVFVPTQGSYLVWKYLFREGIGRGGRCLDVGCGTGLQTVQLAKQRRRPRPRDRRRPPRRPEHAHERVPKRRRRPRDRAPRSTSSRGCRRSATT